MDTTYILVEIHRQAIPGQTMGYPSCYNAQEIELNKVGPIIYDGSILRGEDVEHCLLCIQCDYAEYLRNADSEDRIKILSEAEADSWLDKNPQFQRMPTEQVDDQGRLLAIIAKCLVAQAPNGTLSPEDLEALDPDKPVRGIRRRQKNAKSIFGGQ